MRINQQRLWLREQKLGRIGADPKGGVSRFPWSPEYKEALLLLKKWMEEAGMTVRIDTVGNMYGRYEGKEKGLPAILTGSHLDTVPNGGYFDGLAGIMAPLEAITVMHEQGELPKRSIEVVAFINEEGSAFLGGCFGSKAAIGALPVDYPRHCIKRNSAISMRDAMLEFNMDLEPDNLKSSILKKEDYCFFLELHIEQGKYLLHKEMPLAAVTDIAGIKQFYIQIEGVSCHAGGMAMEERHDAMAAAAAVAVKVEELALNSGSFSRGTVGYIASEPGEHNIVAGKCTVAVDFREHQDGVWQQLYNELIRYTEAECEKRGVTYSVFSTIDAHPVHCAPAITELIQGCAKEAGIPCTQMISFPAHDAQQIAEILPVGMIFLRSQNEGRSHCPEEYTSAEDLADGAEVLYRVLNKAANDSDWKWNGEEGNICNVNC